MDASGKKASTVNSLRKTILTKPDYRFLRLGLSHLTVIRTHKLLDHLLSSVNANNKKEVASRQSEFFIGPSTTGCQPVEAFFDTQGCFSEGQQQAGSLLYIERKRPSFTVGLLTRTPTFLMYRLSTRAEFQRSKPALDNLHSRGSRNRRACPAPAIRFRRHDPANTRR